MIRKIFKTGNSLVVSLPKEALQALRLSDGAGVHVDFDKEQQKIVISPVELPLAGSGVDAEFARQLDTFIDEYRPALEELAK